MKRLESLLVLLGVALGAYLLDLARIYLDMMASSSVSYSQRLWLNALLYLTYAGMIIGLTWYALIKNHVDRLMHIIYIATGALILLMGTPLFFGGGTSLPAGIPYRLLAVGPWSFFTLSGGFIALTGAAGLAKKI